MQLLLGAMGGFAIGGLVWSRHWHRFYRHLIRRLIRANELGSLMACIERLRSRGYDVTPLEELFRRQAEQPIDEPLIPW